MTEIIKKLTGVTEDPTQLDGENPVLLTRYETVRPSKNYIQLYDDAYLKFMQVDTCALRLVLYLANLMDNDNMVDFVRQHKLEFIRQFERETGDSYTSATIDNALVALKKSGLLRGIGRGYFQLNPFHFFRDASKQKRMDLIRMQISWENDQKIQEVIGKKEYRENELTEEHANQ